MARIDVRIKSVSAIEEQERVRARERRGRGVNEKWLLSNKELVLEDIQLKEGGGGETVKIS